MPEGQRWNFFSREGVGQLIPLTPTPRQLETSGESILYNIKLNSREAMLRFIGFSFSDFGRSARGFGERSYWRVKKW